MKHFIALILITSLLTGPAFANDLLDRDFPQQPTSTIQQQPCDGLGYGTTMRVTHDEDVCLAATYVDYYKPQTTDGLAAQGQWEQNHPQQANSAQPSQPSGAPVAGFLAGAILGALLFRRPVVRRETVIIVPPRTDWRTVH